MKKFCLILLTLLAVPIVEAQSVTLPLCFDFEGATDTTISNGITNTAVAGIPELTFTSGVGGGRLRTNPGAGFAQSGSRALTLDRDPSGAVVTNFATIQLNMSNYDATTDLILLDYSIMEHGDEVHPNDKVWIRGSISDVYVEIADWNILTGGVNGVYFTDADINVSAILIANSQNFSSTFEIRFGQEDNFPATSTTASDGLTIDDVCLRQLPNLDATPVAIVSPSNNECGSEMMEVCATFENVGSDTLFTVPVTLNWMDGTNSGTETVTYADTLLFGNIDTICFTPINSIAGGTFTFEVITGLVGDQLMINDTLSFNIDINSTQPVDIDSAYCLNAGDSLSLTPNVLLPGYNYIWYDSIVDGNVIYTGDTLWTGPLMNDTSYFIESTESNTFSIGAPDNNIGAVAQYTFFADGIVFDVAQTIVIDSVTIYPEDGGDVVLRLLDNTGAVINTVTVTIPAPTVAFDPVRIGVNMPVGVGTGWQLDGSGTTLSAMMRNSSGAVYPYSEPGVMDLTGAINGLGGFYYFWYDWKVSTSGCPSIRKEVTVTINPTVTPADPGSDLCDGDGAITLIEGTPSGGAFTGTGVTGSQFDPTVAGVGTHTITYTYTTATGCSSFADTVINVLSLPTVTPADLGTDTICVNEAAITLSEGTPAGGTFSGTGVTGSQFDPSVAGVGMHSITYTFTDASGCIGTADATIVVDGCANINEQNLVVKLHPNPATNVLHIELEGNFTYAILDTKGAVIANGGGNNMTSVNTTSFQSGVYFVNITADRGTSTSKLIIR